MLTVLEADTEEEEAAAEDLAADKDVDFEAADDAAAEAEAEDAEAAAELLIKASWRP